MIPTGPKRKNDHLEKIQPRKRQKKEKDKNDYFATLPLDVFKLVLEQMPLNKLLLFGHTSKYHHAIAEQQWNELRKKEHYTADWVCCNKHSSNYYLSQNVVSYIKLLKRCTGKVGQQTLKKFKPVCDNIPAFKSLVELTQLKTGEEVSADLEASLRQEKVLGVILEIYQFARAMHGQSGNKQIIKEFEKQTKPKIEQLLEEGATYISLLTMRIFARYFLIDSRRNSMNPQFATEFAMDLSIKAKEKGDDSSWKAWKDLKINIAGYVKDERVEKDFEFIRDKFLSLQDQGRWRINWWLGYQLKDVNSYFKTMRLDEKTLREQKELSDKLGNFPDQTASDLNLLCALFKFYLQSQNWVEADKLSTIIIGKPNVIEFSYFLLATAKIKVQLNKLNEAVQIYDTLMKQADFHKDYSTQDIIEETFTLKSQVFDWAGADVLINNFISENWFQGFDKLYQQFIQVKRQLGQNKEAEELSIINYILHLAPNEELKPEMFEAFDKLFQTSAPTFTSLISVEDLFKVAAICFNQKHYDKADFIYNQIEMRKKINCWYVDNMRMCLFAKGELNQWQKANELWELYNEESRLSGTILLADEGKRIKQALGNDQEASNITMEILLNPRHDWLKADDIDFYY